MTIHNEKDEKFLGALIFIAFLMFILLWLLVGISYADTVSDLIPSIIQAESSGNALASDGQSYGLMGISPCVLSDFNKNNNKAYSINYLFISKYNREVGEWYLRWIQTQLPMRYENSRKHLIFAYNTGLGKLKKNGFVVPEWTKSHPNKIYRAIYNERG